MEADDEQASVLSGPYFWSSPYVTDVRIDNNVAQARDGLASERNLLSSVRVAVYLVLSTASVLGIITNKRDRNWMDWVLFGLLLGVAALIPLFSLLNYAHALDSWQREVAAIHTTRAYTLTVLAAAVVAFLIMVRELTV